MSEKKHTLDEINERDATLLSAFIDGELSDRKTANLKIRLENDVALRSHLEEMRMFRQGFREWFKEEAFGNQQVKKPLDVWSAIEHRLNEKNVPQFSVSELGQTIFTRITALVTAPFRWSIPAQLFTSAAAVAVIVLMLGENQLINSSTNILQTAKVDQSFELPQVNLALVSENEASENNAREIGQGDNSSARASVPRSSIPGSNISGADFKTSVVNVAFSRKPLATGEMRGAFSLKMPATELFDGIPRGLKTGEVEIDWIKTNRLMKIVQAKDHKSPPVIWVASR